MLHKYFPSRLLQEEPIAYSTDDTPSSDPRATYGIPEVEVGSVALYREINMPPVRWVVDGLLKERGVGMVYGESGSMKSYSVIDLACRMVNGMDFHGRAVEQGEVIYIIGEAEDEVIERIEAWCRYHGKTDVQSRPLVVPWAVTLHDEQQMSDLTKAINSLSTNVRMVVFDTLSDCTAGLKLNDPDHVGEHLKPAVLKFARSTKSSVILVHHTGHDSSHERGARILRDMTDTTVKVSKSQSKVTWKVEKLRRAQKGDELYFKAFDVSETVSMENMALLLPDGEKLSGAYGEEEVSEVRPTNTQRLQALVDDYGRVRQIDAAQELGMWDSKKNTPNGSFYAAVKEASVLRDNGWLISQ